MKKLSNKGFTLVELIIVIAILAIIMLIAIPNFSGILQRQQVSADKNTAANIGKAVRIWYTQYDADKSFANQVKGKVEADDSTVEYLPQAKVDEEVEMIKLSELALVSEYIDPNYKPSSLKLANGSEDSTQEYYIGLVGSDTYAKVAVCIAPSGESVAGPTMPKFSETDGTSTLTQDNVLYTGEYNTDGAFDNYLAYLEP